MWNDTSYNAKSTSLDDAKLHADVAAEAADKGQLRRFDDRIALASAQAAIAQAEALTRIADMLEAVFAKELN